MLRAGGVLDENMRWDEMVTLHFGQNRPKHYRFKDMVLQSDKDRFDNVDRRHSTGSVLGWVPGQASY